MADVFCCRGVLVGESNLCEIGVPSLFVFLICCVCKIISRITVVLVAREMINRTHRTAYRPKRDVEEFSSGALLVSTSLKYYVSTRTARWRRFSTFCELSLRKRAKILRDIYYGLECTSRLNFWSQIGWKFFSTIVDREPDRHCVMTLGSHLRFF
jgi:hypothetical protein